MGRGLRVISRDDFFPSVTAETSDLWPATFSGTPHAQSPGHLEFWDEISHTYRHSYRCTLYKKLFLTPKRSEGAYSAQPREMASEHLM